MAGKTMFAAVLCVALAAAAQARSVPEEVSVSVHSTELIAHDLIAAAHTRTLLQSTTTSTSTSTSSSSAARAAAFAWCFPYYLLYNRTNNVLSNCLGIATGNVTGSGDLPDDCATVLEPLLDTFTPTELQTTLSDYDTCLTDNGYTINSAGQRGFQSFTYPAVTMGVINRSNIGAASGSSSSTSSSGMTGLTSTGGGTGSTTTGTGTTTRGTSGSSGTGTGTGTGTTPSGK